MKKLILLLAAAFSIRSAIAQTTPAYLPTSGLLAWYPFTGNTNDSSGNGNDATGTNVTLAADRYGTANSAYDFNSSLPSMVLTPVIPHTLQDYAVSVWMNASMVDTISGGTGIHGMGKAIITSDLTGYGGYGMGITSDYIRCLQDVTWHETSYAIETDKWYSFIANFSASAGKTYIYINGSLLDSVTYTPASFAYDYTNFRIGNDDLAGAWDLPFDGKIDDIAIFDRTLTDCEIYQLYHSVTIATTAGTISGLSTVSTGSNITLSDAFIGGGTWSATNIHATVSAGGVVTGVSVGTDTIKYSIMTPCGPASTSKVINVTTPTAVAIVSAGMDISLYPNPVIDGKLTIMYSKPLMSNASVMITDITGRIVYTGLTDAVNSPNKTGIDIAELGSGVYFIRLLSGEIDYSSKIAVVH